MTNAGKTGHSAPLGFVVIGRNEGPRLADCLRAIPLRSHPVIYADSGSTDGSAELAAELGAVVVRVDETAGLTAARGRNAGLESLRQNYPACEFVQFLDGDCIMAAGWAETALEFLCANPTVAVACGRRFEARPEESIYNRMCDDEWDTPVGKAEACGGDSMMRIKALEEVGGFRSELRAGEEPELAARLRAAGWEIWRLDALMAEHDAAIRRFGQWWLRAVRGGFGFAQVWTETGNLPRRLYGRQLRSAFVWVVLVPLAFVMAGLLTGEPLVLLGIPAAYFLQIARMAWRRPLMSVWAWQSAAMTMLAKIPESIGALKFMFGRERSKVREYRQYKGSL